MEVDANKVIEIYKRRISEMDYQLVCYELMVQELEEELGKLKEGREDQEGED